MCGSSNPDLRVFKTALMPFGEFPAVLTSKRAIPTTVALKCRILPLQSLQRRVHLTLKVHTAFDLREIVSI